ncbi:MAG: zinc ribbon domain-containing protein [Candidatus Helarchaeota archaeon]
MELKSGNEVKVVNSRFIAFGLMYLWIGIIYVFQILVSMMGFIIRYFGVIISILESVLMLTNLILLLVALGKIKSANRILNSSNLAIFYSRLVEAIIISIIGNIIIFISKMINPVAIYNLINYITNRIPMLPVGTMRDVLIWVAGVLLVWISYILVYIGYKALRRFFKMEAERFPWRIRKKSESGARNLKIGALMWVLGFLVVTMIVGVILNIIGYFQIGVLRGLSEEPIEEVLLEGREGTELKSTETKVDLAEEEVESEVRPVKPRVSRYCTVCGEKLDPDDKFCPECGTAIE